MSFKMIDRCSASVVFLLVLFFGVALDSGFSEQDYDDQPDAQEVQTELAQIDRELEETKKVKNANTRELSKVAQRIYEYRSNSDLEDSELRDLRERLVEAEKKYRELLTEFNRKILEQPEVKELKERRSELLQASENLREKHSELIARRTELRAKLADLKAVDGEESAAGQ